MAEYAFLSSCINIPEVTSKEILDEMKSNPGVQIGDVKDPLASHVANEYNHLYTSDQRGGNSFAALRCALCILLHAQTVWTVLCEVPEFQDILHAKNGNFMSTCLLKKEITIFFIGDSKNQDKDWKACMKDLLAELQNVRPLPEKSLAPINSRPQNFTEKTLSDIAAKSAKPVKGASPRQDLIFAIIAMFFHWPAKKLKVNFPYL